MTRPTSRDLSFKPIDNPAPRHLTTEQIAYYNEHGYIRPLPVFDELEAIRNRAYFDWVLASIIAMRDGRNPYDINGYETKCRSLYDIITEPRILDYVEDILGPDFVCWGSHFFCKMPGDPKIVPWHQDASYWPFSPSRTVTAWLAIDDATIENSAMKFIPDTHRMGHLEWKQTDREAVLNQEIQGVDKLGAAVYDELNAGQISLHADMLAHGSDPNTSNRRRCGLTIRYCPTYVRDEAGLGWNGGSVVVRGSDSSGHWANNQRPAGEDFRPFDWQIHAG